MGLHRTSNNTDNGERQQSGGHQGDEVQVPLPQKDLTSLGNPSSQSDLQTSHDDMDVSIKWNV